MSPVSEWDDAFEGLRSLLSIELSPPVHLSLEEVPTLQSTLALCIKRDVNDWAHHTPTKVFLPTHILTPLTLKGYPYSFL